MNPGSHHHHCKEIRVSFQLPCVTVKLHRNCVAGVSQHATSSMQVSLQLSISHETTPNDFSIEFCRNVKEKSVEFLLNIVLQGRWSLTKLTVWPKHCTWRVAECMFQHNFHDRYSVDTLITSQIVNYQLMKHVNIVAKFCRSARMYLITQQT